MVKFSRLVITDQGSDLIMKIINNEITICFTKIAVSDQIYSLDELGELATLEGIRQTVQISDIEVENADVIKIHAVMPNADLAEGYYIRTVGLYANDPDKGELLFGAAIETSENGCYFPASSQTVTNVYFNMSVSVGKSENVMLTVDQGAVVTVKQLNKVLYPAYEEAAELIAPESGESIFNLFGKIRKAVKELISHLTNKNNPHEVTKLQVGLGNVDNTSDQNKPVSTAQQNALDLNYQQSTGYTDQKIANLINGAPETLDTLKEIADAMAENESVVEALDAAIGVKASQEELDTHINNETIHITSSERGAWNGKLDADGDSQNNTVTFTSGDNANPAAWTNVSTLASGEKHGSILNKISIMFKNIRWLYKVLGTTDISNLGNGTVTGALAQLNTDYLNGWKTNPNTYVPVTYGDGFEKINIYDQVRCSRLNNGMRCINGTLYATKEVTPSDEKPFLSVPNDFAVGGNDDSAFQRWLGLIEVSSGRVYNCRFSWNNIYGWGAYNIPANSTLSIYLLY